MGFRDGLLETQTLVHLFVQRFDTHFGPQFRHLHTRYSHTILRLALKRLNRRNRNSFTRSAPFAINHSPFAIIIGFECSGFFSAIGFHSAEHLIPIDAMGIEFGSIDTDELCFATYGDAARTAHSGAIHHDGIERSFGRDIVFGGSERNELHHNGRTDSDTFVNLLAVNHLLYSYGYDTFLPHRAIVRHQDHLVRPLSQFIFEDDEALITGGEDSDNTVSCFFERLGDRQHRCCTDTAARTHNRSVFLNTRGTTERSDYIMQTLTGLHCQEFVRGRTYLLNNQSDCSLFDICSGDGQRHTLRMVIHTNDHKMPRTPTACNKRGLYHHFRYVFRKETFTDNLIHIFVLIR